MTLYSRMERSFYIMSSLFVNYSIAKVQKKITFWILALATLGVKANRSLHLRAPTCPPSITRRSRKDKGCELSDTCCQLKGAVYQDNITMLLNKKQYSADSVV